MKVEYFQPEYKVIRDMDRCIDCGICVKQCANEVHLRDKNKKLYTVDKNCVNCHRCVATCPVGALTIEKNEFG
ncbi:MAG: 4Fe-4S dicluster domain-containing protein, partial [Sphaerochaetaceae bacterium]